jgi:hypothetical protein
VLLVLWATWASYTPPVSAQSPEPPSDIDLEHAQELYREGLALTARAEYARAIEVFEQGYRLSRLPGFLFNLAQAHRLAGHCAPAARVYREFLATHPGAEERALAETHLGTLGTCAEATPPGPPSAKALGGAEPTSPTPAVAAARENPPVSSSTSRAGRNKRMAGLFTATGGLALLGVSLYAGYRASDAAERVDAHYAKDDPVWSSDIADVEASGQAWNTAAISVGIAAGASLLTGGVLYYLGWRESKERSRPVSLRPLDHGMALAWETGF